MADIESKPLKYRRVYQAISEAIISGRYQSGERLPTEHDMVHHFGTSRATIIRALRELERNNLVRRRQGSGSFVMENSREIKQPLGILNQVQPGHFSDSIQEQMQRGLMALAQAAGCPLFVHSVPPDVDPRTAADALINRGIGGGFMVPLELPFDLIHHNEKIADAFEAARIPMIVMGSDVVQFPRRSRFDTVNVANRRGGFLQTEHVLSLGCKRVIFLGVSAYAPVVAQRRQGYQDALQSRNIDIKPDWMVELIDEDCITEDFVKCLMKKQRPDAIVCKSDAFAAIMMRQLLRLGCKVPDDVKLVGFDDRPIATLLPVPLTTIRQPVSLVVEQAMALLQSRIRDFSRPASSVEIDVELIVRESTVRP